VFTKRKWFHGRPIHGKGGTDIGWYTPAGTEMQEENWFEEHAKSLGLFLNGKSGDLMDARGKVVEDNSFYLAFNAHPEPVEFILPKIPGIKQWMKVLATAQMKKPAGQILLKNIQSIGAITVSSVKTGEAGVDKPTEQTHMEGLKRIGSITVSDGEESDGKINLAGVKKVGTVTIEKDEASQEPEQIHLENVETVGAIHIEKNEKDHLAEHIHLEEVDKVGSITVTRRENGTLSERFQMEDVKKVGPVTVKGGREAPERFHARERVVVPGYALVVLQSE
jgi:hypothetical protein